MVRYSLLPLLKDGCVYNSSAVVYNKLFVFGGCDMRGRALKSAQSIDLINREEFNKINDMPRVKAGSSIVNIDGKIITIGGIYDKQCPLDKVDIYDIGSDQWTETSDLPNPIQGAITVVRENVLYCAGGMSSGMTTISDFGMLDLSIGQWQRLPNVPTEHFSAGGFLYEDAFYIIGGRKGKMFTSFCNCFDFRANAWRALPAVPNEYRNIFNGCVKLNDHIYVIGGLNEVPTQGFSDLVYRFDLRAEKWEQMPNILKPRADFGAFGNGEQVIIAGGIGQLQGLSSTVEIFNVQSKKWSLVEDMPTVHASSTMCTDDKSMFLVSGMSHTGPSKHVTEIHL